MLVMTHQDDKTEQANKPTHPHKHKHTPQALLKHHLTKFARAFSKWCSTQSHRIKRIHTQVHPPTPTSSLLFTAALLLLTTTAASGLLGPAAAHAMAIPSMSAGDGPTTPSGVSPLQRGLVFAVLFVISSAFHAAETSITTLYPWKGMCVDVDVM
jgi:hypothetical protein